MEEEDCEEEMRPQQIGLRSLRKSPSFCPSPTWRAEVSHKFHPDSISFIGKGNFAEVFIATSKSDDQLYALKVISVENANSLKFIQREINNGTKAIHKNIVRLYESISTSVDIILVLEYMEMGELYFYIEENGNLTESQANHILRQVFEGLSYLHKNKVVHRDVKPENVLLSGRPPFVAKLADLGLSRAFSRDNKMNTLCGSPEYCAPEIMDVKSKNRDSYDEKIDVWAAGIVAYVALSGYMPFSDESIILLIRMIQLTRFKWPDDCMVSLVAKSFVETLLTPVDVRPSARDALDHEWFVQRTNHEGETLATDDSLRMGKKEKKKKKNKKTNTTMPTGFRWGLSVLLRKNTRR